MNETSTVIQLNKTAIPKETDLTGAELVDQQRASLRVLPAVEAVQLSGHLIQLFVGVVELSQELRVCPLHKHKDAWQNGPLTCIRGTAETPLSTRESP